MKTRTIITIIKVIAILCIIYIICFAGFRHVQTDQSGNAAMLRIKMNATSFIELYTLGIKINLNNAQILDIGKHII